MTKVIKKVCQNDYHGSDFINYCLYRDCDQSNRYICKNCIQQCSHSHHNHSRDVIEIQMLKQQLQYDSDWIYDNFHQIQYIVHQLEELQNLINIERKYMLLFKTQKLKNQLSKLSQGQFKKAINLIKLDEARLNLLIQEIYFYNEYSEACNLLRCFGRFYRFDQINKSGKPYEMMQQIKEQLAFLGSRKFDQNKYKLIEVEMSKFRNDCVYISQNEQLLASTFSQQLNLITLQNMYKKQCNFQSPIQFIEFTENINFLFVQSTSNLKLFNIAAFKSKFTITDGYHIYDDRYSFLVRSYRKIKYYNKQSRKQIWKSDTMNDGISYEKKNQLIAILEDENISIINLITKDKMLFRFKTYQVQQMILRDKYLYISASSPELQFLKFNINTEFKCTNLIISYIFSPQFYFSVDKNQNIILYDDKNINIYNKYFMLDHQIKSPVIQIIFQQKLIEISQSSKNLILLSERTKNICYYIRQRNK